MKNNFLFIIFIFFFKTSVFAENLIIEAKNISIDKNKTITVFEKEVVVQTQDKIIKSDYVKYYKDKSFLILKDNIIAKDTRNNTITAQYAEYDEINKIFSSKGQTKIITSEKYTIEGEDIVLDSKNGLIFSKKKSIIKDENGNNIFLDNFEYLIESNIFKSIGFIKIQDNMENTYEFSQIYIDTKKKEILGTDIKSFLNSSDFKINKKNKPRIYANTVKIDENKKTFNKSIFSLCNYRKKDKCPPWSIQATKMLHDNKKKTIYYDNAIIKIYNVPIFYIPKLSHPDPTIKRRSGFLPASFSNNKTLGSGISLPYFFNVDEDKNFTLTSRYFTAENPLFIGEYHQAFKNSNFLTDFGFTDGYKNTDTKKKAGQKSHFFSRFTKNFDSSNESKSSLNISVQNVSNDKYLKLYKIKSNLVDYNQNTLESSIDFTHEDDDFFLGINASVYETLNENYNDKYEYILPDITIDKNLFSNNKLGVLDLQTNLKSHNYDTNKVTNFLINDFNWNFKDINYNSGLNGKILGHFKNVNYETKNVDLYKEDTTAEFYGALGYLAKLNLEKSLNNVMHTLTPKFLLRYSPGEMRQETDGDRLNPISAFTLDRLNNINSFETGLSSTFGFDYKINKDKRNLNFAVAQIINEKENKKMHSKTSLDEKLSDLVGAVDYELNDNINLKYNFAIDQNYKDLNYNELGTTLKFNKINIDFDYLQEKKHIGDQEYFKTKINLGDNENRLISLETKRNLISNSSEFYDLSYEYINDCLRAGLVYRREFYNDSELEPENSLMFKVTLTPFGNINSPSFNK
jgi:LPS-assembly protein